MGPARCAEGKRMRSKPMYSLGRCEWSGTYRIFHQLRSIDLVPKTVELFVKLDDETEQRLDIPVAKAPIFLAFCEFGEPKYLDPSTGTNLEAGAVVKGMTIVGPPMRPVA